jgi:hypothetical protein
MKWGCVLLAALALLAVAPRAQAATYDLEYEASILNVLTLGRIGLAGTLGAAGYQVSATMRTAGAAQLFDDTRISARASGAVTKSGALAWSRYDLSHAYAKKFRRVGMQRSGSTVTAEIAPGFGTMGNTPATAAQKAASFDPLSAILAMAVTVGRKNACPASIAVFDGRQHYTLVLSTAARGTYRGGGYAGSALVCNLRYQPISGDTMSAKDKMSIPRAQIWFADPAATGFAAPLRITVPTPLGEGRIDVKKFTVS